MAGVAVASPKQQFLDGAGMPLAMGFVFTYLAGTTIKSKTWQDRAQLVENENPIPLDEFGAAIIMLDPALAYRFDVTDALGALQPHLGGDNIVGAAGTQILGDVTAAKNAALGEITTAKNAGLVEMDNSIAEAEAAADAAQAAAGLLPGALIAALIGTEASAIAIDANESPVTAMRTLDSANPLNNKTGGILDFLTGVWTQPKLCTQIDRRTLKWSSHNMAKQTDNPGANITGVTTAPAQDSDGLSKAATITATSAVQAAFKQLTVSGSFYNGMHHMLEWIVKAGTAPFGYIGYDDGADKFVYFNTATWALGTTHASITATSTSTRADGSALPAGYRRITAYFKTTTNSINIYCGLCNADGSKVSTVGQTITAEKPFLHVGVRVMDYFENTGTTIKVGVPYDHAEGVPGFPIDIGITYNALWVDDLTNAVWVKTNCTATFDQVGPHGAPCSRLTFTAANGTCYQTIVSATANQIFTPFLRRAVGTGRIWVTSDSGVTEAEIAGQLNLVTFTRLFNNGTTNPVIGWRGETLGDAIDVALANNANTGLAPMPMPIDAATRVTTADNFTVPTTLITAGIAYTWYADFDRRPGTAFTDDVPVRAGNVGFTQESTLGVVGANGVASMTVKDGVVTKTYPIWKYTNGERIELTDKMEGSKHVMSINGEPPAWITTAAMPAVTQVKISNSGPLTLRRFLFATRAVDRDLARTWRYSAGVRNGLVSCAVVAWDRDAAIANATMNREPKMVILSDNGTAGEGMVTWGQKHDTGHSAEAPQRLMQRKVRFSLAEGIMVAGDQGVMQQQAGWVLGQGHLQSPVCFKHPAYSTFPGRLQTLYTGLENPDFTVDKRSVYTITNDDVGTYNAAVWSAPTKLVAAAAAQLWVVDPSGAFLLLPPTHPSRPNRMLAIYYWIGGFRAIFSDDWGVTWASGAICTPAVTTDETNVTIRPDGTLIATSRVNVASTSRRSWATSVDGGQTFVDQGMLSGYNYAAGSNGIAQLDPTGVTSPFGRIALAHPTDSATRKGIQIEYATDAAMTFGNGLKPYDLGGVRYTGYNCITPPVLDGNHLIMTAEIGSVPFNTDNSAVALLIKFR